MTNRERQYHQKKKVYVISFKDGVCKIPSNHYRAISFMDGYEKSIKEVYATGEINNKLAKLKYELDL